jgi:Domain of unknown function (DUF4129)
VTRRALLAVAAAIVAVVLLALAASSGPVRVWSVPADDATPVTAEARLDSTAPPPTTVVPGRGSDDDRPPTDNIIIQVFAVLLAIGTLAALVVAVRLMHDIDLPQLFGRRRRRVARHAPLPEFPAPPLAVDAGAARAALRQGDPRNAIVACWMQLERDAAAAGLPRHDAETSQEYVERVVAAASVDGAPIGALAALYREARFSRHPLTDGHVARAADALERVVAALDAPIGSDA